MAAVRTILHTVLFWTYLVLALPVYFVPAALIYLVTLPFDPNGKWLHLYTSFWCGHHVAVNPMWKLRITGRHHIQKNTPYVLCANHQSAGDIAVLFNLYVPYKFVSKYQNFHVPFIGWTMHLNRYVRLVRGDRDSVTVMFAECKNWLRRGVPVLMFPEGTRSRDGQFLPFKIGAFRLARDAGVAVVPIVIDGTLEALPRDAVLRQKGLVSIRVDVGEPIESKDFPDDLALCEAVRERMLTMQRAIWAERGLPVKDDGQVGEAEAA